MGESSKILNKERNIFIIKAFKQIKKEFNIRKCNSLWFKLKAIILIFLFILNLLFIYLEIILFPQKERIRKFYDVLPKIDLKFRKKILSLNQIFKSRELFIDNSKITKEYIHFVKPLDENIEKKYKQKLYEGIYPNEIFNISRPNQYNFSDYFKLCYEEKLIDSGKINYNNKPLLSVIIPSFNKEKNILKSLRSIQNQSLKNIEIIIVDDCSTDNSSKIYNYLLKSDPRIRIFHHIKNMGLWKSRLDGFLYSRAEYVIHFDMDDYYTDNFILEDSYNIVKKYQLDFVRFAFFQTDNETDPYNHIIFKTIYENRFTKINYGYNFFDIELYINGPIWERIFRANIAIKGLDLLDEYIYNAYKNLWDDRWWNKMINKFSFSNLMINRFGYLYISLPNGEGKFHLENKSKREKAFKEIIYFYLFNFLISKKESNKRDIVDFIVYSTNPHFRYLNNLFNVNFLPSRFEPYEHLLSLLLNDPYVLDVDKIKLKNTLYKYKKRFKYS